MPNPTNGEARTNPRIFAILAQSLLNMLIHYTEDRGSDRIPDDAELRELHQSPVLPGIFRLTVRSAKWECPVAPDGSLAPLDFRFQGKKVYTLGAKGSEGDRRNAREVQGRE